MQTFLIERAVPAALDPTDPAVLARHARWATDAYLAVGAVWLGGVVTDGGMYSLVTAETTDCLERYRQALSIPPQDMIVRRVIRPLGPFLAEPRSRGQT